MNNEIAIFFCQNSVMEKIPLEEIPVKAMKALDSPEFIEQLANKIAVKILQVNP